MSSKILFPLSILLLSSKANAFFGRRNDWTFDEVHNFYVSNKESKTIFPFFPTPKLQRKACEQCSPFNSTDCATLEYDYLNRSISASKAFLIEPKFEFCFSPLILYYSGSNCILARFICDYANLFVDGTHIHTGERKIWDLRMPYAGKKFYENRLPYSGIASLANCTSEKEWTMPLGIRPYSQEKIIMHQAYCLP